MCDWVIWLRWFSLAVLLGLVVGIIVILIRRKTGEERRFRLAEIFIGLSGLLIGVLGLTVDFQGLCEDVAYRLRITSPQPGSAIIVQGSAEGAVQLAVFGTSRYVAEDPDLYVYVLVHSVSPYAVGWWIAAPVRPDPSGWWQAVVWVGSAQSPVQT